MTKDNHYLGMFVLSGIPPAPRGVPKIEVMFEVDSNGILTVSATDLATGQEKSTKMQEGRGQLSGDDVERLIREAEEYAIQDDLVKKRLENVNNVIYDVRSQFEDEDRVGGEVLDRDKTMVLDALKDVVEWIDVHQAPAASEDFGEKISDLQSLVNPTIGEIYGGTSADKRLYDHDDL